MTRITLMTLMCVVAMLAVSVQANAEQVLDATNTGWFANTGLHNGYESALNNHYTGEIFDRVHRSFFKFDLTGLIDPVGSATFRAINSMFFDSTDGDHSGGTLVNGYKSPDPTETLALFEPTVPVANLTGNYPDPADAIAIYNGLGNGTELGSVSVSDADNQQYIEIELNAAGIEAINNAFGSTIAFGAALTTLSSSSNQWVFGFSDGTNVELVLTPVPEPTTGILLALGLAGLAGGRSRWALSRQA